MRREKFVSRFQKPLTSAAAFSYNPFGQKPLRHKIRQDIIRTPGKAPKPSPQPAVSRSGKMGEHQVSHCLRRIVGGALLIVLASAPLADPVDALAIAGKWTITNPPINFIHIEFGEINRHDEAVGYHHRPHGVDPPDARVQRVVQPPDANGVYRARVALRDPATGSWLRKKAPSTFYPDAMTPEEVMEAILAAFHDGEVRHDGQFVGRSGRGFAIEGWYQNGRINAAYPLRGN